MLVDDFKPGIVIYDCSYPRYGIFLITSVKHENGSVVYTLLDKRMNVMTGARFLGFKFFNWRKF